MKIRGCEVELREKLRSQVKLGNEPMQTMEIHRMISFYRLRPANDRNR